MTVDAGAARVLGLLPPGRIPVGRPLSLVGPGVNVTLVPDAQVALHEHEPGDRVAGLSDVHARGLGDALRAGAVDHVVDRAADGAGTVRLRLVPTDTEDTHDTHGTHDTHDGVEGAPVPPVPPVP